MLRARLSATYTCPSAKQPATWATTQSRLAPCTLWMVLRSEGGAALPSKRTVSWGGGIQRLLWRAGEEEAQGTTSKGAWQASGQSWARTAGAAGGAARCRLAARRACTQHSAAHCSTAQHSAAQRSVQSENATRHAVRKRGPAGLTAPTPASAGSACAERCRCCGPAGSGGGGGVAPLRGALEERATCIPST